MGGLTPTARSPQPRSSAAPPAGSSKWTPWRSWASPLTSAPFLTPPTTATTPRITARYRTPCWAEVGTSGAVQPGKGPGGSRAILDGVFTPAPRAFISMPTASHPYLGAARQGEPLLRLYPSILALRLRFLVGARHLPAVPEDSPSYVRTISWTGRTLNLRRWLRWAPPAGGWMWQTSCHGDRHPEAVAQSARYGRTAGISNRLLPPLPVGQRAARIDEYSSHGPPGLFARAGTPTPSGGHGDAAGNHPLRPSIPPLNFLGTHYRAPYSDRPGRGHDAGLPGGVGPITVSDSERTRPRRCIPGGARSRRPGVPHDPPRR